MIFPLNIFGIFVTASLLNYTTKLSSFPQFYWVLHIEVNTAARCGSNQGMVTMVMQHSNQIPNGEKKVLVNFISVFQFYNCIVFKFVKSHWLARMTYLRSKLTTCAHFSDVPGVSNLLLCLGFCEPTFLILNSNNFFVFLGNVTNVYQFVISN
jgi:hypothetical protein